jgi:pimeloyl-ACP methyl ester carboxylesterase
VAPDDQTTHWLNNKLTHRYFHERDGVRLAYYVQGKADEADTAAPTIPIVLLHPLIQGSYSFNLLAQRLCQEYRVIYMDPRGSGASDRPSGPFDFGVRVQDAVAILRQLPYPKFVLFGDSDGVRMAAHVYHAMPERVDRMVLFGGMVRMRRAADYPNGFSDGQVEFALQTFVTPDYRTGLANFAAAAFSEPGLSAWRDVLVEEWFTTIPQAHFEQFVRDVMDTDDRALLPGVRVPTLVIGAEGDILVPPIPFVQYVADHIPGARFALIKGSSHSAPWTAINTFLEMTTTFIKTGTLPRTEWEP